VPATCGSLSPSSRRRPTADDGWRPLDTTCLAEDIQFVDSYVRAALAFRGMSVIDGETINLATRQRTEERDETSSGDDRTEWRTAQIRGALFADATPAEQAVVLDQLGADGILGARVWIGAEHGIGARRTAMVQLRVLDARSGELIWASRCEVEIGGLVTDAVAVQRATECAFVGAPP
jgi:hypothetical protein